MALLKEGPSLVQLAIAKVTSSLVQNTVGAQCLLRNLGTHHQNSYKSPVANGKDKKSGAGLFDFLLSSTDNPENQLYSMMTIYKPILLKSLLFVFKLVNKFTSS